MRSWSTYLIIWCSNLFEFAIYTVVKYRNWSPMICFCFGHNDVSRCSKTLRVCIAKFGSRRICHDFVAQLFFSCVDLSNGFLKANFVMLASPVVVLVAVAMSTSSAKWWLENVSPKTEMSSGSFLRKASMRGKKQLFAVLLLPCLVLILSGAPLSNSETHTKI